MGGKDLSKFFENYLNKTLIFENKKSLQSNYTPETIPHRDDQIEQMAGILAPSLRMEKPSNVFVYGKTGTGKTCVTQYVMNQIINVSKEKNLELKYYYLNCKLKKIADTEYRLMAQLCRAFGKEVPATGLPTEEIYRIFIEAIDDKKQLIVLVLDEIDQLVTKAGDGILYNLTRLNSELKKCEFSIIGISNDLMFTDNLDPRIRSSLSEEELVFPPYNAIQLQDILRQRAQLAFKKESVEEGVIEKCAAYAAREHGDARRALELLRVAGELAERNGENRIRIAHLGDLGHKLSEKLIEQIGDIDMLMIPVGGEYTIGPKQAVEIAKEFESPYVIPMHYKVPGMNEKVFGKLSGVEEFLKELGYETEKLEKLSIKKDLISYDQRKAVVLEKR